MKRREDDKVYDKNEPTTTGQKFAMRSLLGNLFCLFVQTRPEIGSELSRLSMRISTSNVGDIACLNKIARSVKTEPSELKVANIGCQDAWKLVVFTDASLANNSDCSSQSGYLVFLMNSDNGKFSLLAWRSQKLRRIARSTLSAERMACVDGIDAASLFQNLLAEILVLNIPILPVTDNASLINAVYSSKTVTDKRLRADLGYLKSFIDEKILEKMIWVTSKLQLADCLTKIQKWLQIIYVFASNMVDLSLYVII